MYNRGVEKRDIFLDDQDYATFLFYLKVYLMPIDMILKIYPLLRPNLKNNNMSSEITILGYCLMPNHLHLLVRQSTPRAIVFFMRRLITAYCMYFNKKYDRVGSLFQGPFRGVLIETDELLVHISRYIHLNPVVSNVVKDLRQYKWSSYNEYLKPQDLRLCDTGIVLGNFKSSSYEQFVQDQVDYATKLEVIKHASLD